MKCCTTGPYHCTHFVFVKHTCLHFTTRVFGHSAISPFLGGTWSWARTYNSSLFSITISRTSLNVVRCVVKKYSVRITPFLYTHMNIHLHQNLSRSGFSTPVPVVRLVCTITSELCVGFRKNNRACGNGCQKKPCRYCGVKLRRPLIFFSLVHRDEQRVPFVYKHTYMYKYIYT